MNPNVKETGVALEGKIFLMVLLSLIAVFIFSNTSVILTKLGFETTTAVKTQLVQTQADLAKVVEVNLQKERELLKERQMNKALNDQLEKLTTVTTIAKEQVEKAQSDKKRKTEAVITRVRTSSVHSETLVQLPRVEIDQLSSANIEQVTEVFDSLFPQKSV